jgi:hypothetical protein
MVANFGKTSVRFALGDPRGAIFLKIWSLYNPGKKLVDSLNFQNLSPSPLIQFWYLGDMCWKSTLPEPTLFVGGGGEGFKVNSCFNWKMLTFSWYVFKFGCIFRKVYTYFFQDCLKNTMDNPFTKLIVLSFSKHNFQISMDSILGT